MALTALGNSGALVDHTTISAKTPVIQLNDRDIWTFGVLVDGVWFTLQYNTEVDADSAYAAIT